MSLVEMIPSTVVDSSPIKNRKPLVFGEVEVILEINPLIRNVDGAPKIK
jgi:hypothetical protein